MAHLSGFCEYGEGRANAILLMWWGEGRMGLVKKPYIKMAFSMWMEVVDFSTKRN